MSLKFLPFSKSSREIAAMPIQWLKTLTFVFFLLYSSMGDAHSPPHPSTIGSVDSLEYDYADQQLRINGWIWDSVTAKPVERLQVAIDKEKYHINTIIQTERPDVKAAQGIPLLRTGFSAVVPLRHALPAGKQTVEITAILADGRPFQMQSGQHGVPEVQVQHLLGFIDSVSYEASGHQLKVNGWTWNTLAEQPASKLNLSVQGENYEIPLSDKVAREDVQNALHLSIPTVGFSTKVALRSPLPSGSHTITLTALFADERSLQLPSQHGSSAMIHIAHTPSRHWALMTIAILGIALGYFTKLHLYTARAGAWIQHHPSRVSMAMGFSFALLVAFGTTGSSWLLLSQGLWGDMLDFAGSSKHLFKLRDIRSDEWSVLTPNVLAQWNHHPSFPIINTHLGLEGQNMGVIGMTGVPIAQPAALGRLATWGYFLLPLRQAMSWHWLFPFFGCLFFLWQTLNVLLPERKAFNLLLSFTFCVSPYAAGWSLWPLYATLFPLAIFVFGAHILQTSKLTRALPLGVGIGILISGWVLVLYPPWQITTGTLLAFVAVGWAIDQRAYLRWNKVQWLSLSLALIIAAALLISWWLDTVDAVAKLRATVYPGGRTAMQGADIVGAPWWALRGYLNPEVLYSGLGPGAHEPTLPVVANQSEISSYIFLPLPVLFLGLWHSIKTSSYSWTLRACLAFITFTLVFYFFGIPLWLSNTIYWSYVTSARLDLAAALACTFVLGLVWGHGTIHYKSRWAIAFYLGTALASAGLALAEFQRLPQGLLKANSLLLQLAIALIVGWSAWWLMRGRPAAAVALILLISLISTLTFNPISQAPQAVRLSGPNADIALPERQHLRTLVISEGAAPSMMLAAAGVSTVGGVFYYPHEKLWESLGLTPQEWPTVNRYQHLSFKLAPVTTVRPFQVSNSQGDTVIVALDPQRFSFSHTGAKRVVAQEKDAALLRSNASLVEIGHQGGLFWFAVHPHDSENKIPNS